MNRLDDPYARVLHCLVFHSEVPRYLKHLGLSLHRIDEDDRGVTASVVSHNVVPLVRHSNNTISLLLSKSRRYPHLGRFHAAVPLVFGEPVSEPFPDGGLRIVDVLGPLGVAAYKATWKRRLYQQRFRKPLQS